MAIENRISKLARKLNSEIPFFRANIRRTACQELVANQTARAVPFLVSALANSDEEIRKIAEKGLESFNTPEAIDALILGYILTKNEALRRILTSLGHSVSETDELPAPPSFESWQFQNKKDGTTLSFVPEGDFLAGKENFSVHLPPYYLAVTCVTNAQYAQFLTERQPDGKKLASWINLSHKSAAITKERDNYKADSAKTDLPVIWVTWEGSMAYCKWAGLRLPSELEWEKGARGIDGRIYPWGDEWEAGRPLPETTERKPEEITSVCAYPTACSPYGLYQMIGNVYEWCADSYEQGAYQRYSQGDLRPPPYGEHKVLRGGPWRFGAPAYLRTEYRKGTVWRTGTLRCGFRCAKSP